MAIVILAPTIIVALRLHCNSGRIFKIVVSLTLTKMVDVFKFGLVCIGLLFGTSATQAACLAMNIQDHHSSTAGCHDDAEPYSDATQADCCSVSHQQVPVKENIVVKVSLADSFLSSAARSPAGPELQSARRTDHPPTRAFLNRLSLLTPLLI